MNHYNNDFYGERHADTLYAARTVLHHVHNVIPGISSAIDLGCGVGTWLSVLAQEGVQVFGMEGNWLDKKHLVIPKENFEYADLSQPVKVSKRYSLAISLEVAEHLPEECADQFVESLTNLSDHILFSAAIPYQGGHGHVNEQWPSYWADKFWFKGYVCRDLIRPKIWADPDIPWWYRQNIFIFSKAGKNSVYVPPKHLVHPMNYLNKASPLYIKEAFCALIDAVERKLKG